MGIRLPFSGIAIVGSSRHSIVMFTNNVSSATLFRKSERRGEYKECLPEVMFMAMFRNRNVQRLRNMVVYGQWWVSGLPARFLFALSVAWHRF